MNSVRVGDIGTTITGKTPSTKNSEYFDGDIMFVTPVDLKQNYYINESERHITNAGLNSIKKNSISGKSVLVGCIGNIGDAVLVDAICATNQQINAITNIKDEYSPEYVYYWFVENGKRLQAYAGNTVMPILNKSSFEELVIQFPDKAEQDKIVSILSTIDEMISANSKIIDTSENLMREIYDYWFVQFDFPNKDGRPYKSSNGEMVYNEALKREIPKGWSVKPVGEVAELYQPKTISEKDLVENGEYLVYGANGIVGKYNKYNHEDGEIAICCRGASCGEYLMTQPYSWITGNAMVVTPKPEYKIKEYIYYGLSLPLISKYITGSAQPQITRTNLGLMTVIVPPRDLLDRFEQLASETRCLLQNCFKENQQLASLRDWLLPMLLNGQIRVSD